MIGAGPAGYTAVLSAAEQRAKVLVVEKTASSGGSTL
ncbi:FAD-binding protein [Nocardia rhamnosiphila]